MDRAPVRLVEAHRLEYLRRQRAAWEEVGQIRASLAAVEEGESSDSETQRFLEWARDWADRTDPLLGPLELPPDPAPSLDALQEHLPEGWSAHGSDRGQPLRHRYQPDLWR